MYILLTLVSEDATHTHNLTLEGGLKQITSKDKS